MFTIILLVGSANAPSERIAAAKAALDDWHLAAVRADEAGYFKHLTPDAVFMGTDATERWTRDEFFKFAHPYFARGKAWSFRAVRRHVYLSKDNATAWFDEDLDTPNLGPCRGSGVLSWDGAAWKIAHYNLTVPIPNAVFPRVKALVAATLAGPPHVVFLVGEQQSKGPLPAFARRLEREGGLRVSLLVARNDADVPDIAKLDAADLLVLTGASLRLPAEQMTPIKRYVEAGRPLMVLDAGKPPLPDWPAFGREVLKIGVPAGNQAMRRPRFQPGSLATPHPMLQGVSLDALSISNVALSGVVKPTATVEPVVIGTENDATNGMVAWTTSYNGGRVFATVLGNGDHLNHDAVKLLLSNAVFWALDRPIPSRKPIR